MNLTPIDDRIIVKPDPLDEKVNGIIIPIAARESETTGTIVAVGPGLPIPGTEERVPMNVGVGDKVLYRKFGGSEIIINGDDDTYLIMRERDVFAFYKSSEE